MNIFKKLMLLLFVCSSVLINASQKDVKVLDENKNKTFVPSDAQLKRAATATKDEKTKAAIKASTEKNFGEVEFWIEHGANVELLVRDGCSTNHASLVAIALKYAVHLEKDAIQGILPELAFQSVNSDIMDLFLADSRFDLEDDKRIAGKLTLIQRVAFFPKRIDWLKKLLFLGVKPTMSDINPARLPWGSGALCAYEWALRSGDNEKAQIIEKAHKGDFSFINDEERKHFMTILSKRMNIKSNNVFDHLRAREIGRKQLLRLGSEKTPKKDDAKNDSACAASAAGQAPQAKK